MPDNLGRVQKIISTVHCTSFLEEDLFLLELVLKKYLIKYKYTPSNCKFSENIMKKSINKISKSNSLVKIFETWIETGNGQHEFMHRDW